MADSNTMDLAIQILRVDKCEIISKLVAVIKLSEKGKR